MRRVSPIGFATIAILVSTGCSQPSRTEMNMSTSAPASTSNSNPLFVESTLPYQLPPLDRIRVEHFKPALEAGMAEQQREIEAITKDSAAATFANTIVPLEKSGQLLARTSSVFSSLTASNTNADLEQTQTEMSPKLAAHSDWIFLNPDLFARVSSLHERRTSLGLDPESLRLLERYYILFVRSGAKLNSADQTKLKLMNEELSKLSTQFRQLVLKGVNASAVVVDNVADLEGLSPQQIAVAAEAAKTRQLEGKWVIPLLNTTQQPPMAQLKNRALREKIFKASTRRGLGGEFDTTKVVAQMVKLRAERATLLGYPNHAAYVLEDETALTADAVNGMLAQLARAAVSNAKKEAAAIQQVIDSQAKASGKPSFRLEAWDWDFYAEQVRAAKYSYDEAQVRPYFEMDSVLRNGVLFAAQQLYGITFKEHKDLPTYHEDMRVFEVFNADGSQLGLFLVDWYARDNKRGGAWMSSYVDQSRLMGTKAVVLNNLNIPKPPAGQPTLLTFDEVTTAFHEFGHAVHGLFSDVQYPQFSGTSVPRDFVEYPSQYNEMWATDPRVLANYAKHHETGQPMPQALMDKVLAARKFNQGYVTTEYLAAALVDQALHQLKPGDTPSAEQIEAFEAAALKRSGIDFYAVPPRYRTTFFSHVFSSGYSAGYYAYIWSDVLARATEHWFDSNGGLTRANGDRLRQKVLSRGFSVDALTMFKDFYGKEPDIGPLLESRGLTLEPG
jgi:peptidyl-dipeptidase Dcp